MSSERMKQPTGCFEMESRVAFVVPFARLTSSKFLLHHGALSHDACPLQEKLYFAT